MYYSCAKSYIYLHGVMTVCMRPGGPGVPCTRPLKKRANTQPTLITGWTVRVTPASSQVIQTADETTEKYTYANSTYVCKHCAVFKLTQVISDTIQYSVAER